MATGHHYGPGPWVSQGRPDWTPVYYHRADTLGIGFDRTANGSNAVEQYFSPLRERLANRDSIAENLLLFFHHVRWTDRMRSGRTVWEEMVAHYNAGVDSVKSMEARVEWRAGIGGRRTLRRGRLVPHDPGEGSDVVARCGAAVFRAVFSRADSVTVRTARASVVVLSGTSMSG